MVAKLLYAPLSLSIQKEYTKLMEIIADIPCKQRTMRIIDSTNGKIGIVDIIAYQIGWGKLLINWYEQGLHNKKQIMPGEGFTKWDYAGIARHFYEKYRFDGCKKQEQEFHTIVQYIFTIVEKEYQTGNLDKLGIWDWCTLQSGKQWPLHKWITVNTVAPYKRATAMIKKSLTLSSL